MNSTAALKEKSEALRKTLAQIDKLTGKSSERERDALRKRSQRLIEKIVVVPPCQDRARREALEQDDAAWLMHYYGPDSGSESPFTYEFTAQQREMIDGIRQALASGDDQSIAASRGEGKTSIAERMTTKDILSGAGSFRVLFGATGSLAEDSLQSIKTEIETNDALCADYPEVCVPVRALESTPSRAHYQAVSGVRHDNGQPYEAAQSKFSWCGEEITMPNVPGSPSARAIIATRGLDSAVRGLKKKGRRPDGAIIDDPDTEDSARSEQQANKLERRIDRAIAGLGGQKRRCARVMLTTLQSRIAVSYRYTDPDQKPSWHGRRYRFLVKPPERVDLWDEYVELVKGDWRDGTKTALEFYVARRADMEAGALVANVNRYVSGELSALQHYFNCVARTSPEAVATEFDNDPPAEAGPQESGITEELVRSRLNGRPRGIVPDGTIALTAAIDLGKFICHYVIVAWLRGAVGVIVDYGEENVYQISDDGPEPSILNALLRWRDRFMATPPVNEQGEPRPFDRVLIDSGYCEGAAYKFAKDAGAPFFASKGASGFLSTKRSNTWKPGNHWAESYQANHKLWLRLIEPDPWKRFAHDRFLTPTFDASGALRPGSLSLWGSDQREHIKFSKHIVSEIECEEFIPGKGLKRKWDKKGENHKLDATYMNCAAADMCGVKLMAPARTPMSHNHRPGRPSAMEVSRRLVGRK